MKKQFAGMLMFIGAATLCWAQGTKTPFDLRKAQEELAIMKGILGTALSFAAQDSAPRASSSWRFSNINAFYLAGQGAVFVIPRSGLRNFNQSGFVDVDVNLDPEFYQDIENITQEVEANAREVALQAAELARENVKRANQEKGKPYEAPPASPAPPAPPAKNEALRQKIDEFQKKAKQNAENLKAKREQYLERLPQIKDYLIETLANYGDSMTTVKPAEYINLVLAVGDFGPLNISDPANPRTRHDVLCAQKSWITDYKAGRLTLEAFKAKVLQYSE